MIVSLLLSGCSHTGEYRERGAREFEVVQRPGESGLEFFLCEPAQADCQSSPKTPYSTDSASAVTAASQSIPKANSSADGIRYPDPIITQLKAFEMGEPIAIHFDFESARLDKASKELLSALVSHLQKNGQQTLAVRGETDGFGSRLFNNALAGKRLQAVIHVLTDAGFPRSGILLSKKARCCRNDSPNGLSVAAARGERVVLLRGKDARPD